MTETQDQILEKIGNYSKDAVLMHKLFVHECTFYFKTGSKRFLKSSRRKCKHTMTRKLSA